MRLPRQRKHNIIIHLWEWREELPFHLSGKPVASFMWFIGHTLRPNGEILEGNSAAVDGCIPVTGDNYPSYYDQLLQCTLAHLFP